MIEWWKGAAATFTGIATFCWSVHYWNEGYRRRGETHPITRWLEQYVSTEEEDRQRRIEFIERESLKAERRLAAIHKWFPTVKSRHHEITLTDHPDSPEIIPNAVNQAPVKPVVQATNRTEGVENENNNVEEGAVDYDEEDIEIVLGSTSETKPSVSRPTIDLSAVGQLNGTSILEADLESFEDRPWRKPGADITDYFNYGFNEITWKQYCAKQKGMREENKTMPIPPVIPGMPFPPMMPPPFMFRPPVPPPPGSPHRQEVNKRNDRSRSRSKGRDSLSRSRSRSRSRDRRRNRRRSPSYDRERELNKRRRE